MRGLPAVSHPFDSVPAQCACQVGRPCDTAGGRPRRVCVARQRASCCGGMCVCYARYTLNHKV